MSATKIFILLAFIVACRPELPKQAPRFSSRRCEHPALPAHSLGHIRILNDMFVADRDAHRTTFGYAPPDPSRIELVTDPQVCANADDALDSALAVSGGVQDKSYQDNGSIYVYRTGELFAVTDANQQASTGDLNTAPIFFFFSSKWKYLGERSR
jgi:hypothetical protein